MSRRKNTFLKAIKHLKESPTNSTSGVYSAVPGTTTRTETEVGPTQPDYSTIDWEIDGGNGDDTSGLFDGAGNHKLISPPGDNSYILGPMVSMYYTYASPHWTRIGYLRESDRRMVNLGTITGTIEDWDGETGFQSYGQLTLEQAAWFKHTPKKPDGYRAFYPGPPSSSPDVFGRYYCTITGTPLATHNPEVTTTNAPLDLNPEAIFAAIMDRINKGKQLSEDEKQWLRDNGLGDFVDDYDGGNIANDLISELIAAGVSFVAAKALWPLIAGGGKKGLELAKGFDKWWNKGRNVRIPNENNASWWKLVKDDYLQMGKTGGGKGQWYPRNWGEFKEIMTGKGGIIWSFTKGIGTGPTPLGRQAFERLVKLLTLEKLFTGGSSSNENYEFESVVLSEKRKLSILNSLKEPVVIPETKQKSYKVRPGRRGKTNFQGMDKLVGDIKTQKSFKEPQDIWSDGWQGHNARLSQDKKNIVLEKIGEGKEAWNYMLKYGTKMDDKNLEEFWGKNPNLYSYYSLNGKKYTPIRKEQVRGDYLVFLVDEVGKTSSMLQSELNEKLSEESDKEMLAEYNNTNEPIPFLDDPLVRRVAKRLKTQIDYPDKPAVKGYPNEPPPKQIDGWHPELGKNYKYDKLDPVSAIAMRNAPTGDQEIDDNVKKSSVKPKVAEDSTSDWRDSISYD